MGVENPFSLVFCLFYYKHVIFLILQLKTYHQALLMVREPLLPKMELESIISIPIVLLNWHVIAHLAHFHHGLIWTISKLAEDLGWTFYTSLIIWLSAHKNLSLEFQIGVYSAKVSKNHDFSKKKIENFLVLHFLEYQNHKNKF